MYQIHTVSVPIYHWWLLYLQWIWDRDISKAHHSGVRSRSRSRRSRSPKKRRSRGCPDVIRWESQRWLWLGWMMLDWKCSWNCHLVGWFFGLNLEILQLFGGSYRKSKTTPETSNIGRINHQKLPSRSKPPAKRAKSGHLITDADSHGMPLRHTNP